MHKDTQILLAHADWKDLKIGKIKTAWYQREITVPGGWAGRRIAVSADYLNSHAAVYLDGTLAGEIRYPGGDVELTPLCKPGGKHLLSMRVSALPIKAVMLAYRDTASAGEVEGRVERRGLCGDVFLVSEPSGARIGDVKVDTSIRKGEVAFEAGLKGLGEDEPYRLYARIVEKGRAVGEFSSRPFMQSELRDGRIAFSGKWDTSMLWDLHTPQNLFELQLTLLDGRGSLLDKAESVRFGVRELWIDGRDFFLNGSRIFLSAVPLDNALAGAALATYAGAKESLLRLKSLGINCVYTHNYGCEPGSHLSYTEILRAADDVGMLVSFSLPHFSHYDWQAADAEQGNGYARHAEFYVRAAQNHPSVVMYSMSHNATGYSEDMNPDLIDGLVDAREGRSLKNSRMALRAEAVVKGLDPNRIVYHHASGNLGAMHTTNFYPNFAPIQELSDWFEHWAAQGVKPVFTCEYGAPFPWDWTMYRGWYLGKRAFGRAKVPWEFCLAEWNSQFLGDQAFPASAAEKANLRWEAVQFKSGNRWHHWDYPHPVFSRDFDERYPVFAMYLADNWRAFRSWGVSAISPWVYGHFWKLRDGVDKGRTEFSVDWDGLQRPGFSPDYIAERHERVDLAYDRSDWVPTVAAEALIRNNRPLLAYIGGKPARFTSKDHNYYAGETVEKQIIVINNSRESVTGDAEWSFAIAEPVNGSRSFLLKTGEQERIPIRFELPRAVPAGAYRLGMKVTFASGEIQDDAFAVHVLPQAPPPVAGARIALFDPIGETGRLLESLGTRCEPVAANADLSGVDILIIGKGALTASGAAPGIERVREGLKVIVFEQKAEVLEKRLGLRATEYGLRRVFRRIADHPLLAGLAPDHLRDWRGEATTLPARLKYEPSRRYEGAPSVRWCDIEVTRAWRCGSRGSVASVLIEKPVIGDFQPILDGGFSLQYSPLMQYREGKGTVVFCQLDVTGRTETEPAALNLVRNMIRYVSAWEPPPTRKAVYAGPDSGRRHLESLGVAPAAAEGSLLTDDRVLIVGPGGGGQLAGRAPAIGDWLKSGGALVAIGLDESEANSFLPDKVQMTKGEHISAFFDTAAGDSVFAGIGPADLHLRDPRDLDLVSGGASVIGNGVMARAESTNVTFCQVVPWQFDPKQQNTRRTYRRTSFLLTRILANLGVSGGTPLLQRFRDPPAAPWEKRWLKGLYLDSPQDWDDPYRFFRW
jgi:hypothetical protein